MTASPSAPTARRLAAPEIVRIWQREFRGYSRLTAQRDLTAGLTVAAVALPLALAFGVASGSTPAAGLVTAIIAGIVIGALGGAPYQISGPTGAMSAVLIIVANDHGPRGLWLAGLMAGIMILAVGILRLGRLVNLIPAPVVTGFTSGIALVIFIGQIDNFLGIQTPAHERSAQKAIAYVTDPLPSIEWHAVAAGLVVIATMVTLPRLVKTPSVPAALLGISLATALSWGLGWDVRTISAIPRGIVLDDRLIPSLDDLRLADDLLAPAFSIALLGAIESLLCGVVAGRMTGQRLAVNQEMVAQGIGNIILPFFGGVPATAAIARTSVGVKAGGTTRLVSIIHALALLLGALFLASVIGHIPLAALAGVLFVTAWRMNEWHAIQFYWRHRIPGALAAFAATMLATVALDLTQAIAVGVLLSLTLFLVQVARLDVTAMPVDWQKAAASGLTVPTPLPDARVVYVSGALFFGSTNQLVERIEELPPADTLILSMRGVPMTDVSSVQAIEHLWHEQSRRGGDLYITGLQPSVRRTLDRAGLTALIGGDRFLWSADQAIARLADQSGNGTTPTSAHGQPENEGFDELPLGVVSAG